VYQGANCRAILKTNDERESGQNAGHVDAGVPHLVELEMLTSVPRINGWHKSIAVGKEMAK